MATNQEKQAEKLNEQYGVTIVSPTVKVRHSGLTGLSMNDVLLASFKVQNQSDAFAESRTGLMTLIFQQAQKYESLEEFDKYTDIAKEYIRSAQGEIWLRNNNVRFELSETGLVKLPRCFTQATSNIRAQWKRGFNPKDYKTESAFRNAHKAKVETKPVSNESPDKSAVNVPVKLGKSIDQKLATILVSLSDKYELANEVQKARIIDALQNVLNNIHVKETAPKKEQSVA